LGGAGKKKKNRSRALVLPVWCVKKAGKVSFSAFKAGLV
jgi:hypothetical protein